MPILLQVFLVLFLIGMNGFFVAAEFCCVKMRPSRLETLIQEGNKRAVYAKKLTDELDEALSVTQLGITLASLGLGWVGEPFVAELILPVTQSLGLNDTLGHTISFALAFTIITAMHIILGELTPKSLATLYSLNLSLAYSGVIKAIMIDQRMLDDPFVQSSIYQMIRNRINEAKVGVLKVHGNYSIVDRKSVV